MDKNVIDKHVEDLIDIIWMLMIGSGKTKVIFTEEEIKGISDFHPEASLVIENTNGALEVTIMDTNTAGEYMNHLQSGMNNLQ